MRDLAGNGKHRRRRVAGGLFCLPVLALLGTGAAMLAAPHVDGLTARPYAHVAMSGPPASPARQAAAAVAAVSGSVLLAYELPPTPDAAVRITVARGMVATRLYIHPQTLRILRTERTDDHPLTMGPFCVEPDFTPLDRLAETAPPRSIIVAPMRPDDVWLVKAAHAGAVHAAEPPRAI